jgi:hypothetical protein
MRLCVSELLSAFDSGEVWLAVNHQNIKAAKLIAVKLLNYIIFFHFYKTPPFYFIMKK